MTYLLAPREEIVYLAYEKQELKRLVLKVRDTAGTSSFSFALNELLTLLNMED